MIHLHLESKLSIDMREIPARVVKELKGSTTHKNPQYWIARRSGFPTRGIPRRIETWIEDGRYIRFWRGSLGTAVRTLKRHKLQYEIVDQRLWLPKVDLVCSIKLRDYQKDPVHRMVRRQQTIGRGEAGAGKTEMLLAVAAHFKQPTLVLVWDGRQQMTWLERVPKYFAFEPGGIGGAFKKQVLAPITIGMVQSVRNRLPDLKYRFGCVICDEVQRFAASTFREVVNELPAAVRLGASDDERRRDGQEFLLYDTFGPRSWSLARGTGQCTVEIVLVPTGFKYSGLDFSPNEFVNVVDELVVDDHRNLITVNLAELEVLRGHRVLIWSDRVEHCRYLKEKCIDRGLRAGLILGTKRMREEADATENGLRSGTIDVGIGTKPAEQSINVPPLDRGIMTCASAGRKMYRFKQMRGRLARPFEGKRSRLYYIWDRAVPGLRRKARNIKQAYPLKIVRHNLHEERSMAGESVAVTLESLKAGCKQLKIKPPKGATLKKLERLIDRELSKDPSYGAYTCGACQRDITSSINPCPWCQAKYKPLPDEERPEEEPEELEDELTEEEESGAEDEDEEEGDEKVDESEEEEGEEGEEGDEEGDETNYYTDESLETEAEWDEDGQVDNPQEQTEEGYPVVYDAGGVAYAVDEAGELVQLETEEAEEGEAEEGSDEEDESEEDGGFEEDAVSEDEWEDGEEGEEVEEEQTDEEPEEEPEPPKARKKSSRAKKQQKKQKEKEREAKREQIKGELPYSSKQLLAMKHTTRVMVAGVLGIKDPLRNYDTAEDLIRAILKKEKEKWPERFKSSKKKPSSKKSSKKAGKKKSKR